MTIRREKIKNYLFPKIKDTTSQELNVQNINSIQYVSLMLGIAQIIALVLYIIIRFDNLGDYQAWSLILVLAGCAVICAVMNIWTRILKKNDWQIVRTRPQSAKVIVAFFLVLIIAWGMGASFRTFVSGQQMISFYVVMFIVVGFIHISPAMTILTIAGAFTMQYIILYLNSENSTVNEYNFFMLATFMCVGAVMKNRQMVNYIEQVNMTKELNNSLEIIARHDSTTRLQNRYAFNQQISGLAGREVCLAIGDIDDFKGINDALGHLAGDTVLKHFADILLESFGHDSVFRYGGDEFIVTAVSTDLESFRNKLKKANEKFENCSLFGGRIKFSCTFGSVKDIPETAGSVYELLSKADKALYDEKTRRKAGRTGVPENVN